MSDEPAKILLGDTAISSIEQPGRRRLFRRKSGQQPPLIHCENCGALLHGPYCAICSQPAVDYRRSFRYVIGDVLDSFLSWDSKLFATIWWLIVRPWRLTNEFLAGHRVRYLNPLRLYLLASILFFFVVNYWVKSLHVDPTKLSTHDRAEIKANLDKENISSDIKKKVREAIDANAATSPASTSTETATPTPTPSPEENSLIRFDSDEKSKTPFEKWLEARAKEKLGEHGANVQLFLKGMVSNLPYMVLCCIPLFAFVLKLLYIGRRLFYIDHLIYALHIHTFAYVGIMLIGLITIGLDKVAPPILAGWIVGLLWLWFAIQVFMSIRRVYRQGWFRSIFKFFVGGFIYLIVLFVALAATFLITIVLPS